MPIEYFDTRSSARCKDADPFERRARFGPAPPVRGRRRESGGSAFPVRWPWNRGSSTMAPTRGQGRGAMSGDRVSEQGHRARIGVRQSQQHPDRGGLPGAVGAQVAEGASPGDEELDAVHGDVLPEPLGQSVGLDGPVAVGCPPGGRWRAMWWWSSADHLSWKDRPRCSSTSGSSPSFVDLLGPFPGNSITCRSPGHWVACRAR